MAGHAHADSGFLLAAEPNDMLGGARMLALEVPDFESVRPFYADTLDLALVAEREHVAAYRAGDCRLELREVGALPRGGAHVHYALAVAPDEYDAWVDRLTAEADIEERTFGNARSLYRDDPAGHCVELGERGSGPGVDGVFEVVLEITDLEAATDRYTALGFEVVDRGTDRRRTRLTTGAVDLELWEPQYGIAGARGGDHVDWTLAVDDAQVVDVQALVDESHPGWSVVEQGDDSVVLRDVDGHRLTLEA